MSEKIFIVGASGDIGSKLVRFLLKKEGVEVTVYVRDAEKTKAMFAQAGDALNIVQGDYNTTDVFEREIAGHSRLFILIAADHRMPGVKGAFAEIAYGAGVRQIVDISSNSVNMPFRSTIIGTIHRESEEKILAARKQHDQFYVALRPDRFFSTHFKMDAYGIKAMQALNVICDLDLKEDFISTTDIAELASIILTEPVEKHVNCVYTLIGETISTNERAAIFSELLGKPIRGNVIPAKALYDQIIGVGFPHSLAIEFSQNKETSGATPYYSIMLGRPAQTFREWLQEDNNLSHFQ